MRLVKCVVMVDDSRRYNSVLLNGAQKKYSERGLLTDNHRYLVSQFCKPVSDWNQYRLSAIYSDVIFSTLDIDAIIYPSVQTELAGTCIAISPKCVNTSLRLTEAIGTKCIMKDKKLHVVNIGRYNVTEKGELIFSSIR